MTSIPARFRASRDRRNQADIPHSFSTIATEKNSVLVGEQSAPTASNLLVVRRGSEPVLNANLDDESATPTRGAGGAVKRRVEFLNAEIKVILLLCVLYP